MNPVLHARARQLRREQTDAERLLWSRVRDRRLLGLKFRRQYPVGPYLADFCCIEQRLIVELDGGQHVEQVLRDAARTAVLARYGYRVLRFWDHEVLMATEAVLERIVDAVGKAPHENTEC